MKKSLIILALIVAPTLAQANANNALKLCRIIDGTGLTSTPCEVGGWDSTIQVNLDMSSNEARKVCPTLAGLHRRAGFQMNQGWTLKIKTPYSNTPVAYCSIQ